MTRLGLALLLPAIAGCVRLTPYDEVLRELPADEFLQIDGQWVHIERGGNPGAPGLVLIHGFGGSTYSWRPVAPELAEHFDVISIDLNGFGYTQRPATQFAYSTQGQVRLLISVLDALGLERAHLVGHSYGADVVLIAASLHPERVASLILVDGGVVASEQTTGVPVVLLPLVNLIVRAFVLDEGTIRQALEDAVFDPEIVSDEMVREYLARLSIEGLRCVLRGFSSGEALNTPSINYAAIDQPTLIIWGEDDPVFSTDRALVLAASLPHATVLFIADTGHLLMEERPESLVRAIRNFVLAPAGSTAED